jgi:hypothetical protein
MSAEVAIVIDIRFDHNAVGAVDDHLVVLVECELNVRFTELDLFPA